MDGFTPAKPLVVNGSREMLSEGRKAIEALQHTLGEGSEVCEIRIYENTPIEAVIAIEEEDGGVIIDTQTWHWNGEAWLRP